MATSAKRSVDAVRALLAGAALVAPLACAHASLGGAMAGRGLHIGEPLARPFMIASEA